MSKVRSPKIGKRVAPAADDNSRPVLTTAFEGTPPREAGHLKGSWSSSAKRMSTETDVSRSLLGGVGEINGPAHATPASTRAVLHYVVPVSLRRGHILCSSACEHCGVAGQARAH